MLAWRRNKMNSEEQDVEGKGRKDISSTFLS
jgi:hypothetical protein